MPNESVRLDTATFSNPEKQLCFVHDIIETDCGGSKLSIQDNEGSKNLPLKKQGQAETKETDHEERHPQASSRIEADNAGKL